MEVESVYTNGGMLVAIIDELENSIICAFPNGQEKELFFDQLDMNSQDIRPEEKFTPEQIELLIKRDIIAASEITHQKAS